MVVRDGFYGTTLRRRRRFRCTNSEGEYHRFVPEIPRLLAEGPCAACETTPSLFNGRTVPRHYDFSSHEVGSVLTMLARGSSYRASTYNVRATAGLRLTKYKDHGQLAGDWVEAFAGAAYAPDAETRWPDVVILDSTTFWRRRGGRSTP